VAGMAVGMIAIGAAAVPQTRCKMLHVEITRPSGRVDHEVALVDACVNTAIDIGSRALWTGTSLRELYCTFGEPHGIGLSSIVGRLLPTGRADANGATVMLTDPATAAHTVLAPLAPGLLQPVGVTSIGVLTPDRPHLVRLDRGTVAVDGEREVEFGPQDRVTVTLRHDGPRVIDVPATLRASTGQHALLSR